MLGYSLFLLLLFTRHTDRLLLHPSRDPLETTGLQRRELRLATGRTIEIFSTRSPGASRPGARPEAYVLTFIGNAARAELTAPFFAKDWGDRPVEVWAVNYPGYGGSTGDARLAAIAPAALAVHDALKEHAGSKPIFVQARSIGTTAALHVAAHRPVAGCILHNPPALRQLILGRYGWWNLYLFAGPIAWSIPSDLDSVSNAKRVGVPAVFLLAGSDEVVPLEYQQLVADAYAGPKRVITLPKARHVDRADGAALQQYEIGLDWLWSQSVKSP